MSWLSRLWKSLKKVFSGDTADLIVRGVDATSQYLPEIYQVVKWIAEMTPTRADDELIRVAERLGVPAILGSHDRGAAIAAMVIEWARRKWPNAPIRRIRRAIEIAYGAVRP